MTDLTISLKLVKPYFQHLIPTETMAKSYKQHKQCLLYTHPCFTAAQTKGLESLYQKNHKDENKIKKKEQYQKIGLPNIL